MLCGGVSFSGPAGATMVPLVEDCAGAVPQPIAVYSRKVSSASSNSLVARSYSPAARALEASSSPRAPTFRIAAHLPAGGPLVRACETAGASEAPAKLADATRAMIVLRVLVLSIARASWGGMGLYDDPCRIQGLGIDTQGVGSPYLEHGEPARVGSSPSSGIACLALKMGVAAQPQPLRDPALSLARRTTAEEQEDVDHVEEYPGRDLHGFAVVGTAQPVEVQHRVAAEDDEPEDGVDHVRVRHRDEQRDEAEDDQREEREEQEAVIDREVTADRVAHAAEAGNEQSRRTSRLPDHARLEFGVTPQPTAEAQPEE